MQKSEKRDFIAGFCSLLFGVLLLIFSKGITVKNVTGDFGSAFLPRLVGWLIVLLSVLLLGTVALKHRGDSAGEPAGQAPPQNTENSLAVFLSFGNLLLYVILLKKLGFILSSMAFLFLQMTIMAEKLTKRNLILWLVITVIVPPVVYWIFVKVFSMSLPVGILKW